MLLDSAPSLCEWDEGGSLTALEDMLTTVTSGATSTAKRASSSSRLQLRL
jgi:hypothetical protein